MKRLPVLHLAVVRFAEKDVIATSGILDPGSVIPVPSSTSSSSPPSTPIIPYKPKPSHDPDEE